MTSSPEVVRVWVGLSDSKRFQYLFRFSNLLLLVLKRLWSSHWFWINKEASIPFEGTGVFCPKQYRSIFNIRKMNSFFFNFNWKVSIVNFYNDNIMHFWYFQKNESLELESCFWPDLVLTLIKFTFQSNFSNKKFKFLRVTLSTCKDH